MSEQNKAAHAGEHEGGQGVAENNLKSEYSTSAGYVEGTDPAIDDLPETYAEAALWWFNFGYEVVPIDNAAKSTAVKWQPWLDKLSHEAIIKHWKANPHHEVGAIVDEDYYILDADANEAKAALYNLEKAFDVAPNLIVSTKKGEHHHFKKAPDTYAVMQSFSTDKEPNKLDVRTGRTKTEGRSIIVLPPSTGKAIVLNDAANADDLAVVNQGFIDAIARHNGTEAPRPIDPAQIEKRSHETSASESAEILTYISADLGYDDWFKVLTGIHDKFNGSDEGLYLADEWSSKGSNYLGFEEIEYKWRSFTTGKGITFNTVAKMAELSGADLKGIARSYDENGIKRRTFEEQLLAASQLDQDTAPDDIETLAGETAALSSIEREKVLKKLKATTGTNIGDLRKLVTAKNREGKKQRLEAQSKGYKPMYIEQFPDIAYNEETGMQKVVATIPNIEAMLNHYRISASYDVISKKTKIILPNTQGSPDNADNSALTRIISLAKLNEIPSEMVPAYVETIADERQVNPVADWINTAAWDGVDRLPALYQTLKVAKGYPEALRDILVRRWLVSAVAAALKPIGFRARGVLALQGPQSIGKTTWLQSTVPDPVLREALVKTDHMLDPSNKDSVLGAITHWLVELGELDSSFKKDIARMKGFITADKDKIRRPYARLESEYQRRTVFFASVNHSHFLVDDTGNTRFWTVAVESVNYNHGINMQQLWAQVAIIYESGEQWWLTPEEEAQIEAVNKGHRVVSSIRELITSRLDFDAAPHLFAKMTATDVLLQIGYDKPTNPQSKEAGAVLRELLGEPTLTRGSNRWSVPPFTIDFDNLPNEEQEYSRASQGW